MDHLRGGGIEYVEICKFYFDFTIYHCLLMIISEE